ncbi:hypothetical protein [Mycolicibacterium thermoresistibile]
MLPAYSLLLALLVTAPLLAPGYLLLRDAVSTPRSYLTDAALGLSDAAPRALPQDFAVAVASAVVDGGVVVKALLLGGLWAAGWGAARLAAALVPDAGRAGQAVAATLAIWNPYVAERLLQGHWSLLVGYGCLPWVAVAMLRLRTAEVGRAGWAALVLPLAVAGLTPTGLMLAATVALVGVATPGDGRPRRWCAATALGTAVLVALPWLLAPALAGSLSGSQATGVEVFAARAEPGLGTLGSLAGLGGIWNAEAVPASRTSLFAVVATGVLLAVVAAGLPVLLRRRVALPLLALAAVAVLVPALMATGPGLAAVEATVRALPGLGVVRDAQKWVALAVPGYAAAGAAAVLTVRRWLPTPATAAVCCAAVIAVLPDLAWGVGGQVSAVRYPPGWPATAAVINADPRPVAVLPPDVMRTFDWAGPAPVLDPLPRWVRAEVLATGDLTIAGRTVPGEGAHARRVQDLLLSGADAAELRDAGVGWVVVQSPGETADFDFPVAYRDADMAVYRIGGEMPSSPHRPVLIVAHLVWLGVLLTAALRLGFRRVYRP